MFVGLANVAQDGKQMIEVMAIDRAEIVEAEFLEQCAAGQDAAGIFLGLAGRAFDAAGKTAGHLDADIAQGEEAA